MLTTGCAYGAHRASGRSSTQAAQVNAARDRVARFQMEHFSLMGEKLRSKSKSASDALGILRSDNIGFFPEALIWLAVRGMKARHWKRRSNRFGRVTGGSLAVFRPCSQQLRPRLVALELKYEARPSPRVSRVSLSTCERPLMSTVVC